MRSSWTKRKRPREALLFLFPFAVAGIAQNAYATESEPTSATALIREWKSLEAICRGSNEASACEKLNGVVGQQGWCFNGYSSGRRWVKC
jgi:hypothetical protein